MELRAGTSDQQPIQVIAPASSEDAAERFYDAWHEARLLAGPLGKPLDRLMLRLLALRLLQEKGWFKLRGRTDYLAAFYDDWKAVPGLRLFIQRLSQLFTTGLDKSSIRARMMFAKVGGEVPYLGPGLFGEDVCAPQGELLAVRQAFFEAMLGEGGVLTRFPFSCVSQPGSIGPESLGILASQMGFSSEATAQIRPAQGTIRESLMAYACLAPDDWAADLLRLRLAVAAWAQDGEEPEPVGTLISIIRTAAPGEAKRVEGPKCEFKSTLDWDPKHQSRNPDLLLGCLRTVAAFLNSEGGELLIGVNDQGEAVGLESDPGFEQLGADGFENRFRELVKVHLEPIPLHRLRTSFEGPPHCTVCRVVVDPSPNVTYLLRKDPRDGRMLEEIYVRDGARTLNLAGRARDHFVLRRRPGD